MPLPSDPTRIADLPATGDGGATRTRILRATTSLIAQCGYRAATLKAIGRQVGISEPGVYRHFDGKAALMQVAFSETLERLPELYAAKLASSDAGPPPLLSMATLLIDADLWPERRIGVELYSAAAIDADMKGLLAEHVGRSARRLREMLRAAAARREIHPRTDVAFSQWYIQLFIAGLFHLDTIEPELVGNPAWKTFVAERLRDLLDAPPARGRGRQPTPIDPPPPAAAPDGRGARTRVALLEAAAALIAEHGYRSTSMKRVAAAVGISEPAVYRYFDSKADLLAEVYRWLGGHSAIGRLARVARWRDGILGDYVAMMCVPELNLIRRLGAEMHVAAALEPSVARITREHNHEERAALRLLLEDGVRRGRLRHDLDVGLTQWFVHVLMMGLCHLEEMAPHLVGNRDWGVFLQRAMRHLVR